jgi:lipoate-protein ligase A
VEARVRAGELQRALDEDLLTAVELGALWRHRVWEVSELSVVVGRGTVADKEVRLDACAADGVPVLRRRGGGGAVVLGGGCLVVSLATTVERELDVGCYLNAIADFLAQAVGRRTGLPLVRLGTGDVCFGDRKVLGSSLFRRRRLLFYQASLLHSLDLSLVGKYLAHPSREPEYRRGRSHGEFLTTLQDAGTVTHAAELCEELDLDLQELADSRPW